MNDGTVPGDAAAVLEPDAAAGSGARLGERLRALRKQRGWTLADVSQRTGLAVSTLSKVENNRISLTYHNLAKLAGGLELDLTEFFTPEALGLVNGRWTITRRHEGQLHETANYAHEYLCADLAGRRMVPFLTRVKARSLEEFGEMLRHPGEEFFFVVEGVVDLYLEGCEPMRFRSGDSFYFDSGLGHALVSVGPGDAYSLTVISAPARTAGGKEG